MMTARQKEIVEIAKVYGYVTVDDLVAKFKVTPQSIRKDLNRICDSRLMVRNHGGAELSCRTENMSYEARRSIAKNEKIAIGKAVADLIPDRASIFINIGTTNEEIAIALSQHQQLTVITNNIHVAKTLSFYEKNEVLIAAGKVRPSDGGIVGESAVDFINQFRVDFAIIGASGIAQDGTLLDYDFREVKAAQAIITNAKHVILATDSSKHERTAPVRIGHVSQIHSFVTDKNIRLTVQ